MSERNITYLTDACLITCIVEMGSAEKVLEAAKKSTELGCTEMLFVSGDKPELVYDVYRKELNRMGYDSTSEYMIAMSELCLEEGIFPHSNLGIAKPDELKKFKNII